ncbi:protein kinase [Phormidium tenue FACHB-886]|nr:protein kinase [Phormidium tenue FACHB-886]
MTAGLELTPGTLIDGRYRIQRVLGRGGFGRTYLAADDRRFGELCVLKEFAPSNQSDPVVAQKLRELFQREATILHKLNHSQIPQFFAVFEEEGRLFIAQEFINGKTYWRILQERQKRGEAFTQAEILQWLKHLLRVLDYLHSQNIVHRDIAPDNIMLSRSSKLPVLIDFGVVKQAATHFYGMSTINPDGLIQASVSVGKFGYAPYEQIRMGQCSPKSDLYALAVTAVVLLTGRSPNVLIDPRSLEWTWQSQVRLHPRLVEVLEKMMAEKPQDRYPSARLVLRDLQSIKSSNRRTSPRSQPQSQPSQHNQVLTQSQLNPTGIKLVSAPYHLDASRLQSIGQPIGSVTTMASTQVESPTPSHSTQVATKLVALANQTQAQVYTEVLPSSLYALAGRTSADLAFSRSTITPITVSPKTTTCVMVQAAPRRPWRQLKTLLACGLLALLPVGGIAVGVQSPYIASFCQTFDNCADDRQSELRYRRAVEQASSAKTLLDRAQSVSELQLAHSRLADSLAQLAALPGNAKVYPQAQQRLLHYRGLLQSLESQLEAETKATELLKRAEAEAQKATEQTKLAKSVAAYEVAQLQWSRALATLNTIAKNSFMHPQVVARMQEYKARLDAVSLRIPNRLPPAQPELPQTTVVRIAANPAASPARATPSASPSTGLPVASASTQRLQTPQPSPSTQSEPKAVRQMIGSSRLNETEENLPAVASRPSSPERVQTVPSPAARSVPRTAQVAPRTAPQAAPERVNAVPLPRSVPSLLPLPQLTASNSGSAPSTGGVQLSASQTLNNVSLGLDGAWINPGGTYVANLVMANGSDRTFGFVPLFAEVRDASGKAVQARILLRGSEDGMIQPGETLRAQLYLLDRRWSTAGNQNLTLLIREGTSGSRTFSLAF